MLNNYLKQSNGWVVRERTTIKCLLFTFWQIYGLMQLALDQYSPKGDSATKKDYAKNHSHCGLAVM